MSTTPTSTPSTQTTQIGQITTTVSNPTVYYQYGTDDNTGNWRGGNFYGGTFKGKWYGGSYYNSNWKGHNCLINPNSCTDIPPNPVINKSKKDKVTKNQYTPWREQFIKKDTEKL